MLTLYFGPGASSMAPHIALHEIGAPFEGRPISLATGRRRTQPDFLAVNPEGKVPTLLIDGRALTEVAGILFYLARRYPDAGLLPDGDIEAEAQVDLLDVVHRLHRSIRRAARAWSMRARSTRWPTSGWARATGRWAAATRSPTSTCSGCTGASAIRSIPRPASFPTSRRHHDAHDGATGGEEDHRGRSRRSATSCRRKAG